MQTRSFILCAAAAAAIQVSAAGSGNAAGPDRGLFDAGRTGVVLVQSTDPRIVQLEEQVRQLTGRIEELNFLLLQMQEQLRRTQEDNDFRFQELENAGGNGAPERKSEVAPMENPPADSGGNQAAGEPPRNLGEIVINPDGSVKGATLGEPMDLRGGGNAPATDGTVVAALPATNDPEELYSNAYEFILSGDYRTAEAGFREHVERFPDDERSPDAYYWLGEAILSQQRPAEAAEVFLAASKQFPAARKAPDMLLKLGMSLASLGQRDIACATFKEVGTRYPEASDLLKGRVSQERAIAGC